MFKENGMGKVISNNDHYELMIRLEEAVKYIGFDIKEMKLGIKDINLKVDSFENTIAEHKKYMEEHPKMCLEINELSKRLDKKDTMFDICIKSMSVVNVIVILYLTYLGTIRL